MSEKLAAVLNNLESGLMSVYSPWMLSAARVNEQNKSTVRTGTAIVPVWGLITKPYLTKLTHELGTLADNPNVSSVVLSVSSGGGYTSGVQEFSDYIGSYPKPIYAHTDDIMASAAYWMVCKSTAIYASTDAFVGSIGVIFAHTDVSKALSDMGITLTLIHKEENKAEFNSLNPLSDSDVDRARDLVSATFDKFKAGVMVGRNLSTKAFDAVIQGSRLLTSEEARAGGLIDGVGSLDKVSGTLVNQVARRSQAVNTFKLAVRRP